MRAQGLARRRVKFAAPSPGLESRVVGPGRSSRVRHLKLPLELLLDSGSRSLSQPESCHGFGSPRRPPGGTNLKLASRCRAFCPRCLHTGNSLQQAQACHVKTGGEDIHVTGSRAEVRIIKSRALWAWAGPGRRGRDSDGFHCSSDPGRAARPDCQWSRARRSTEPAAGRAPIRIAIRSRVTVTVTVARPCPSPARLSSRSRAMGGGPERHGAEGDFQSCETRARVPTLSHPGRDRRHTSSPQPPAS